MNRKDYMIIKSYLFDMNNINLIEFFSSKILIEAHNRHNLDFHLKKFTML